MAYDGAAQGQRSRTNQMAVIRRSVEGKRDGTRARGTGKLSVWRGHQGFGPIAQNDKSEHELGEYGLCDGLIGWPMFRVTRDEE